MANKSLENTVRELSKTLSTLVNRISALEVKINDQNTLIVSQSRLIEQLKSESTFSSSTDTQVVLQQQKPAESAPLQRPARKARLKAAATIANGSCNKRSERTNDTPKTSVMTMSHCVATKSATANGETMTKINLANPAPGSNEFKCDENTTDSNGNEWKIAQSKNRIKKSRQVLVGSSKDTNQLQSIERLKYIQAWSFRPETTEEQVTAFLKKTKESNDYFVQKRILKTDRHASFIIGVPESIYNCFNSPTVWPQGVRYCDWFLVHPRHQRGDLSGVSLAPTTTTTAPQRSG